MSLTVEARSIESRGFNQPPGDDHWIGIQKKTFENWVNEKLKTSGNKVQDLETDFSDGYKLVILMEALTIEDGCKWKKVLGPFNARKPNKNQLRVHQMETVEFALNIMKFEKLDLTNIGASDIVDQNLKLILGLVWKLILKFQIGGTGKSPQGKTKRHLLDMINTILPDMNLRNFSSDWNSGVALSALCNYCDPSMFPNWKNLNEREGLNNCRQAISQAETKLKVPQILTPENMASSKLDDQSGMTYISYFLTEDGPVYNSLLRWVNSKIPDQRVKNFNKDWSNGVALCALNNAVFPGSCPDYQSLDARDKLNNCQKALSSCSKNGVEQCLTPQELSADEPNTIQIMNQVAKFQKVPPPVENTPKPNSVRSTNLHNSVINSPANQVASNGTVEEEPLVKVRQAKAANELQSTPPPKSFSHNYSHVPTYPQSSDRSNHAPQHNKPLFAPPPKGFTASFDTEEDQPAVSARDQGRNNYQTQQTSPGAPQGFADEDLVSFDEADQQQSVPSAQPQVPAVLELETKTLKRAPNGSSPAVFLDDKVTYSLSLPSNTDVKDISVVIETPSGSRQNAPRAAVAKSTPHKATISFIPYEPGRHFVNCSVRNLAVRGTPFEVFVLPTKDEIQLQQGETATVVNTKAEYVVDCGVDVGDLIRFRCLGPDNKPVNCQLSAGNTAAVQRYSFTPKIVGLYNVSILYNGENIPNSPLLHTVINPSKVQVTGLKDVNVGQTVNIGIDLREAGPGEPEVNIVHNALQQKIPLKNGPQSGQFIGAFKTNNTGPHLAYVYLHDALINGRPFEFNVGSAGALIKCYGAGLQRGVEDLESTFTIDASKAYKQIESVDVKAEGSNSLAKCSVQKNSNNTFTASYRPVETGFYDVSVFADGEIVSGCPYKVRVINPRKVKCTQLFETFMDKDGQIMLNPNKKFSFSFDATSAGPGELKAKVNGPSGNLVPCSVEKDKINVYTISFLPKSKGKYEINVLFDDLPIPRSPFAAIAKDTFVVDIGTVSCFGKGLDESRVGEETFFTIDTSDALVPGEPKVSMIGLHGDVHVEVKRQSEHLYHATYTSYMQGMYLVHVTYADRQVQGSPFKVIVQPSENSKAVEAFGPGLKEGIIGQPIKFGVDTRAARPGILSCHCKGPKKEARVDVIDNTDGTYSMNIQPKEPGKHVLEIKYNNEHIHNSPFLVRISGPPDPSKCRVFGPGLEHGVVSTFKGDFVCDTKGAGAGQLKVRVHGPKGGFKVDMRRDTTKDRSIIVRYNPTEAGDYKIEVWWADVEIPQSPFEVKIFQSPQELEDFLLQYPQERNKYPAIVNGSSSLSSINSQFSLMNGGSIASDKFWKADV